MVKAAIETVVIGCGMAALLFASAGRLDWPMAWIFLLLYAAFAVVSFVILEPSLLAERGRLLSGARPLDIIVTGLSALFLFPAAFIISGLTVRFAWPPRVPVWAQVLALALVAFGYAFSLWAPRANRFFSTILSIQHERGHHLIDTGPYAFIRHPGYAGGLLAQLALPVALGSVWGLVPAACGVALMIVRILVEERMLAADLLGYRDYMRRIPWRLIPHVW